MRKTNYNYFVVEECVDNSVITIEACYDGIWYEKAYFWGISIKEAIKIIENVII